MKKLLAVASVVALCTGCQSTMESSLVVQEEFNREGQKIILTVNAHKNERDLNKAVLAPAKGLNAQATYAHTDNVCQIDIKKRGEITVDDDYATSLGHELMHCLYGDYHPIYEVSINGTNIRNSSIH